MKKQPHAAQSARFTTGDEVELVRCAHEGMVGTVRGVSGERAEVSLYPSEMTVTVPLFCLRHHQRGT